MVQPPPRVVIDWRWIARVLAVSGGSSWELKRAAVAREALRQASMVATQRDGIHGAGRKRAVLESNSGSTVIERLAVP